MTDCEKDCFEKAFEGIASISRNVSRTLVDTARALAVCFQDEVTKHPFGNQELMITLLECAAMGREYLAFVAGTNKAKADLMDLISRERKNQTALEAELAAAKAEIARLKKALDAVTTAGCFAMAVKIAAAALKGKK